MNAAVQPKGPASGYDTDSKAQYRKDVWASFPQHAIDACINDADTYALLLPAKQGQEIQTAMDRGVPEHKIICVDENPALIAVSEWRKTHPTCKFYGCALSETPKKLKRDGRVIAVANFDLCNNFSEKLIAESNTFFDMPRFDGACVAITIAKGRETNGTNILLDMLLDRGDLPFEDKRAAALVSTMFYRSDCSKGRWVTYNHGSYKTNRVPMTYIVLGELPTTWFEGVHVELRLIAEQLDDAHKALQRDLVLEERRLYQDVENGWRGKVSDETWDKLDAHLNVLGPLIEALEAAWVKIEYHMYRNSTFTLLYPEDIPMFCKLGLPFSSELAKIFKLEDYLSRKKIYVQWCNGRLNRAKAMSWSLYYSHKELGIE